jgi:hypothetical protein
MTSRTYKGVETLCERSDNWTAWSGKVRTRINKIKFAWKHVIGEPKPEKVSDEDWELAKYEAMDVILTHIGGSIESEIIGKSTPKEMWDAIKEIFTDRKGIEKCIALTKLMNCQMEGDVKEYVKQFGLLRGKCIEIGWKLEDIFYAINFVNNASDDFGALKQLLLAKGDALEYKDAVEVLLATKTNCTQDIGLKVENQKSKFQCYKCGKTGHFIRECPKWKKSKATKTKTKKKIISEPGSSDDDAYLVDNLSIHSDSEYVDVAYVSSKGRRHERDPKWISDNAATKHMTYQKELFKEIKSISGHFVKVGDGTLLSVAGIGEIVMKGKTGKKYVMKEVLYVPQLTCNLFSIRRCHKSNNTIIFPAKANKYMLIKNSKGERLMSAKLEGKLYVASTIRSCVIQENEKDQGLVKDI